MLPWKRGHLNMTCMRCDNKGDKPMLLGEERFIIFCCGQAAKSE